MAQARASATNSSTVAGLFGTLSWYQAAAAIEGRVVTKPSSLPWASAARLKSRIDEISRMPLIDTSV